MLEVPTGVPLLDDMPRKSCLLYRCLNKATFTEQMPTFDEWGLRPVSLVGPRENPIVVVPPPSAGAELAQVWMQMGEHRWGPMAKVPRC